MFDRQASLDRATAAGCRGLVDQLTKLGARSIALFVAEDAPLELEGLVDALRGVRVPVIGGVFPALIAGGRVLEEGALALGFDVDARRVVFPDIGAEPAELEAEMSRLYPTARGPRVHSVLLFLDAVSGAAHSGRFLETLQLYFHVSAQYIGGGAGRRRLSPDPCLFTEREVISPGGALALRIDRELAVSYRHGWTKLAGPFFASRTEGNTVLELDWRPAREVFEEVLREAGVIDRLGGLDFEKVAPLYPLGILKLRDVTVVRDPMALTPEGGIQTFGRVPQHSVINVLRGEPESLLSAARQVANEVKAALPSEHTEPQVLVVDCFTRELALGDRYGEELRTILETLGPNFAGVLTLGEIASGADRFVDFFNKTIVLGAR